MFSKLGAREVKVSADKESTIPGNASSRNFSHSKTTARFSVFGPAKLFRAIFIAPSSLANLTFVIPLEELALLSYLSQINTSPSLASDFPCQLLRSG